MTTPENKPQSEPVTTQEMFSKGKPDAKPTKTPAETLVYVYDLRKVVEVKESDSK